jgi:hypothetical protein
LTGLQGCERESTSGLLDRQAIIGSRGFRSQTVIGHAEFFDRRLVSDRSVPPAAMRRKDSNRDHHERDAHDQNQNGEDLSDKRHGNNSLGKSTA